MLVEHDGNAETDVSSLEQANAFAERVLDRWERSDVQTANAGIYPLLPVEQTTPEIRRRVTGISLDSLFFATRAFLPVMTHLDMARCLAAVHGIPVSAELVPLERALAPGLIMTQKADFTAMYAHYDECGFVGNPNVLAMLLGRSANHVRGRRGPRSGRAAVTAAAFRCRVTNDTESLHFAPNRGDAA